VVYFVNIKSCFNTTNQDSLISDLKNIVIKLCKTDVKFHMNRSYFYFNLHTLLDKIYLHVYRHDSLKIAFVIYIILWRILNAF